MIRKIGRIIYYGFGAVFGAFIMTMMVLGILVSLGVLE